MKRNLLLTIALLLVPLLFLEASRLDVHCFDAGSADCFLIKNGEHYVMIDTGLKKSGKDIAKYLEDNKIKHIDLLIITHFDKDHIGGTPRILEVCNIDTVIQSTWPKESEVYDAYVAALKKHGITPITLNQDIHMTIGDMTLYLDSPKMAEYPVDPSNNASIITSIFIDDSSLLFMGDAETMRLQEFYRDNERTYEFVKMPHHGRYDAALSGVLDEIGPKYAVITSSTKELEDRSVLDLLSEKNVETYLTREGAIEVSLVDNEYTITQK